MSAFHRRLLCCALLALTPAALPALSAPLESEIQFTTLVVEPLVAPRPFAGADGRTHLAYELSLVNETKLVARIDAIAAVDPTSGATLAEWKGDALGPIFRINGGEPGVTLAPSHSGYAFLDVALPAGAPIPKVLRHKISVTRLMQAPGEPHKTLPLDPKYNLPDSIAFEGADVTVDERKAVVIAPPLRGPRWVAFNGCCADLTSHRGAAMAFNGKALIAERFAIDFIQLDQADRLFNGPLAEVASYPGFGVPVSAVADATVVEASDGAPEATPGVPRVITLDTAAGNHIVLDLGGGNFALYAHLKTGSVAVHPGDHVKTGDVIGLLGSSGNSDAPHLHFHVMDGPSPLASSGLPYEFKAFRGAGRVEPDDALFAKGGPAAIDAGWFAGPHKDELPLNNEVVDFPGGQ